jgi:hypothetical protein
MGRDVGDRKQAALMYAPVREARRLWHERYAEQLCLTASDIAPWLIELPEPTTPLGRSRVFPRNGERGSGSPYPNNGPAALLYREARGRARR